MIQLLRDCPQTLTRVLPTGYFRPQTHTFVPTPRKYKIQWGWHGDGVEHEQLLLQSNFDIVAVFGDNVAGFGDNVAAFGDNVAGVDGALGCRITPDRPGRPKFIVQGHPAFASGNVWKGL